RLAEDVQARFGAHITTHVIVPVDVSQTAHRDGSVLLDPDCALHDRFGARLECLYLVRPDGYIGYRAQPVAPTRLSQYLDRIFASGMHRGPTANGAALQQTY